MNPEEVTSVQEDWKRSCLGYQKGGDRGNWVEASDLNILNGTQTGTGLRFCWVPFLPATPSCSGGWATSPGWGHGVCGTWRAPVHQVGFHRFPLSAIRRCRPWGPEPSTVPGRPWCSALAESVFVEAKPRRATERTWGQQWDRLLNMQHSTLKTVFHDQPEPSCHKLLCIFAEPRLGQPGLRHCKEGSEKQALFPLVSGRATFFFFKYSTVLRYFLSKSSMRKKREWWFKAVAELPQSCPRGCEGTATDQSRLEGSRNRSMKEPGLPHISNRSGTGSGTGRPS